MSADDRTQFDVLLQVAGLSIPDPEERIALAAIYAAYRANVDKLYDVAMDPEEEPYLAPGLIPESAMEDHPSDDLSGA